jgi:hypothetical protein
LAEIICKGRAQIVKIAFRGTFMVQCPFFIYQPFLQACKTGSRGVYEVSGMGMYHTLFMLVFFVYQTVGMLLGTGCVAHFGGIAMFKV